MKICRTCQQTYSDDVDFCPRHGARVTAIATEIEAQLAGQLSRRFRIVRRLVASRMGAVSLSEQIAVGNRSAALKVLNRKLLDDPDFLLSFQNKAASTGRIHHPNVVTIHDFGQADDGTPYIPIGRGVVLELHGFILGNGRRTAVLQTKSLLKKALAKMICPRPHVASGNHRSQQPAPGHLGVRRAIVCDESPC